ncbi:MAG: lytic polysaccharide monooxygenase [Actinomycetota bacterium]
MRNGIGVTLVAGGLAATALGVVGGGAGAHGSNADPPSRTYACRFLEPDNPRCAAAWSAEPQALYDWMEVNIGDAAGRHRELIPDGQLCSAGRAKFAAFDEPGADWPVTELSREADGHSHVLFEATAPHATQYFWYYLTREGFDPSQPLRWDDLELVYNSGALPAAPSYHFDIWFPERTGRHILYMIWQRSDSPEAFYSCSDVTLEPLTTPPPTTAPPTTAPPTTAPPTTVPPPPAPPTGMWRADEAYVAGDRVTLDGVDYVAKWWTRGFRPDTVVDNEWDTPWQLAATPPPTTAPPTTTPPPPTPTTTAPPTTVPPTTAPPTGTWRADEAYVAGDRVTLDGVDYVAKWWTRGFRPDTVVDNEWDTPWSVFASQRPEWRSDQVYREGDRVTFDGRSYVAKWWTRGDVPNAVVANPWDTPWSEL